MGKNKEKSPISLFWLLVIGVISSIAIVGGLFMLFAAYETQTWFFWHAPVRLDQDTLFGVGRNAVTLAAALGVGVTLFFSYRKQQTAENAQELAVKAQNMALESQRIATATLQLSLDKHDLESIGELRNRYARSAEQLGSEKTSIRLAGVHSLIALSDDWHALGKTDEQQVCVTLLCSYMNALRNERSSADDLVKAEVVGAISERLAFHDSVPEKSWQSMSVDLVGAFFQHGISDLKVGGGLFRFEDCHWNSSAKLRDVHIEEGLLSITNSGPAHTRLPDFVDGVFEHGHVVMRGSVSEISPTARFTRCHFTGASLYLATDSRTIIFSNCTFTRGRFDIQPRDKNIFVQFRDCVFISAGVVRILLDDDDPAHIDFLGCDFADNLVEMKRDPRSAVVAPRNINPFIRPEPDDGMVSQ